MKRLICRLFGHQFATRVHYMPGRVLTIARCGRCGLVERSSFHRGRYPMPRASR